MNSKQKKTLAGLPVLLILAVYATFFADTAVPLIVAIWCVIAVGAIATAVAYRLAGRDE